MTTDPFNKLEHQVFQPTINIMADFGNGPYAWFRLPGDGHLGIGSCIADAISGFPEEYGISDNLQRQFARWVTEFENRYDDHDFDWADWNWTGVCLSNRLKLELGEGYAVIYHQPVEDPESDNIILNIIGTFKKRMSEEDWKLLKEMQRKNDE